MTRLFHKNISFLIVLTVIIIATVSTISSIAQENEPESDDFQTGWVVINDRLFYFTPESGDMYKGFLSQDGQTYFLNPSGALQTGFGTIDGNTYYFDLASGAMQYGWQTLNGRVFYFDQTTGIMQRGFRTLDNQTFFFNPSGAMQTGWGTIDGRKYYFDPETGSMFRGWMNLEGKTYFFNPSGAMQTNWGTIDGNRYLFNSISGSMVKGWVTTSNGKRYFMDPETGIMYTGWLTINGQTFFMNPSGAMQTEGGTIDGRQEVFHTNGRWINTTAMDKKALSYSSNTDYLILVSLSDKVTKIYKKQGTSWTVSKAFLCTVGDSSKGWDTIRGDFYIGESYWGNPTWKGYSFIDYEGHTLYYWVRFCDSYLFHSVMYDEGTWNLTPYRNDLGQELSHGCIRLRAENAEWIYDNIPYGTRVIVY